MDKAFAALDSDVRRQILVYLSTEQLTLSQIRSRFAFSGSAILYHVRMLEEAGFIVRSGDGRRSRYRLVSSKVVNAFNAFLSEIDQHTSAGSTAADAPLRLKLQKLAPSGRKLDLRAVL